MTTSLAWLNDLAQWVGRWFPRLVLIEPTHRGVRFGPQGGVAEVGPGLVLYWPISHALVLIPVTTQSIQLSAQVLPFESLESIIPRVRLCAAAIQFRVLHPREAATRALSLHSVVDNRAQAAIARHASLLDRPDELIESVERDLRRELHDFGVALERLDLTQNGIGVGLKNIADWSYSDRPDGKRPE